ncbi:MAG: 6-phosphofructokinase [Selenomonadales bacterium]|nr:6-phosphofructokinase [Selenomonadales bacterium]
MRRIAILTSGGDAPGMNGAIRAVVRKSLYYGYEVYGIERGYEGLIQGKFRKMDSASVAGIIQRGGTVLKTARSKDYRTTEGFNKALRNLKEYGIFCVVVIGGDGSMAGARKLTEAGINTVVIPGTIDNDMAGTDYTIGFDTALNTALEAVNKIRDTVESHSRVAIIEVMGRSAGHIALMTGLACGAEKILLPEEKVDLDSVCRKLGETYKRGKRYSIIVVAEGAASGYDVAKAIKEKTEFDASVTVLGYIQRGGSPSAKDNIMASRMGSAAVDAIAENNMNCLVGANMGEIVLLDYETAVHSVRGVNKKLHQLAGILSL